MFALDIDGTIAYRHVQAWARVCNEQLGLNIEAERLTAITYHDFLRLPELVNHQKRVGQLQYTRDLDWMALHPDALIAMKPMVDALIGVKTLATLSSITYYTARFSTIFPEKNGPMAHATLQWLCAQAFPSPDSVVFCASAADKWLRLARLIEQQPQGIVLIDDRASYLLEALRDLPEQQPHLCRHVTLVAFGTNVVPENTYQMRVIPLPSWRQLSSIVDQLCLSCVP